MTLKKERESFKSCLKLK